MSGTLLRPRTIRLVEPPIGENEIAEVTDVLRSGQLAQGSVVDAFERDLADLLGVRHAIAVNSGTAALHCAIKAANISEGDEVLTSPFTFAASASPVLMQRGAVRFVDIDERTFNVDLESYVEAATQETKAVIAIDLFGLPFNSVAADKLRSRGVRIIEDACQAIGASRGDAPAGTEFDATFSFYATKNVIMGEGGALATNDDAVAAVARRFRHHGQGDRYEYLELGYNYRLTDVLAAIGRVQLRRLDEITRARRAIAAFYDHALADVSGVETPYVPEGMAHAYHQYTVRIDSAATANGRGRDDVRAALSEAGIASGIYYPKPLHLHPLFGGPEREGEFPVAERIAKQVLSLPIHSRLSRDDLAYVVAAFKGAVGT